MKKIDKVVKEIIEITKAFERNEIGRIQFMSGMGSIMADSGLNQEVWVLACDKANNQMGGK